MRIDGRNPLGYMGVRPYTPPQMIFMNRRPTANDYQGFTLGTQWIHQKTDTIESIQYFLASVSEGVAVWVALNHGSPTPGSSIGSINTIYLTTPGAGTYTPSPGMLQCTVECVGGGAGGTVTGGGGGGYCKKLFNAAQIGVSQTYIIGSGGQGGQLAAPTFVGTNGGNTTFGIGPILTANGGIAFSEAYFTPVSPGLGGSATGGDINISGQAGTYTYPDVAGGHNEQDISGAGGSSGGGFGLGGQTMQKDFGLTYPGFNPTGYGGGAGGINPLVPTNGIDGAPGIIVITEYIST